MGSNYLRKEVQALIRVCEMLEGHDAVLTVQESEAIYRCVKQLENKVLPERERSHRGSSL